MEQRSNPHYEQSEHLTRMYLEEIGKHPLLNAEEVSELAYQIRNGLIASQIIQAEEHNLDQSDLHRLTEDMHIGNQARSTMITSNLRLVVSVARKYQSFAIKQNIQFMDLVQEGNIGLFTAVERFDPDKGFKFSTYATWWIRQAVARSIGEKGTAVRTPMHMHDQLNNYFKTERDINVELGEQGQRINAQEKDTLLCERLACDAKKLRLLRETVEIVYASTSLNNALMDGEHTELHEIVADRSADDPAMYATDSVLASTMRVLIDECLTEREKDIIVRKMGLNGSAPERTSHIARNYNISKNRVRQIELKALQKLRSRFRELGLQQVLEA